MSGSSWWQKEQWGVRLNVGKVVKSGSVYPIRRRIRIISRYHGQYGGGFDAENFG